MPPLILWALGAVGAAVAGRWLSRNRAASTPSCIRSDAGRGSRRRASSSAIRRPASIGQNSHDPCLMFFSLITLPPARQFALEEQRVRAGVPRQRDRRRHAADHGVLPGGHRETGRAPKVTAFFRWVILVRGGVVRTLASAREQRRGTIPGRRLFGIADDQRAAARGSLSEPERAAAPAWRKKGAPAPRSAARGRGSPRYEGQEDSGEDERKKRHRKAPT